MIAEESLYVLVTNRSKKAECGARLQAYALMLNQLHQSAAYNTYVSKHRTDADGGRSAYAKVQTIAPQPCHRGTLYNSSFEQVEGVIQLERW